MSPVGCPLPTFLGWTSSSSFTICREMSNLFPHVGGAFPGKQNWKDGVGRGREVGTHVGAAPHHPWVLSHIFW